MAVWACRYDNGKRGSRSWPKSREQEGDNNKIVVTDNSQEDVQNRREAHLICVYLDTPKVSAAKQKAVLT
jgi:hypothetical protein